jgi:O-antigen ligase
MPATVFHIFIIIVIIFSCLSYGGVIASQFAIIEGLVIFLVLFWLSHMAYKRTITFIKTDFSIPIILFLALVIFQLLPLPIAVINILSAKTAALYRNIMPDSISVRLFCLSIYPNATVSELLRFLTYIGIFFLIINNTKNKKQFSFIINTIIFLGSFISIFGIIQKYSYSGRVYWFDASGSAPTPFGPFVNRNNFAGYINMIIPLSLGYSLVDMPLAKRLIYIFSTGVMSLALFLSESRAGILVCILAIAFLLLLFRSKEEMKNRTKYIFLLFIIVFCLFIAFVDMGAILARFHTLFKEEVFVVFGHGYSWLNILRIWQDYPVFGIGLGSFGSISNMFKTEATQVLSTYAHNDYLQLLSETGILGFSFLTIFFILYFKSVVKKWLSRHNSFVVCLSLGGLASVFATLIYSLLDFNLHIPANTLLFFIIMALVYCLTFTQFNDVIPKQMAEADR